MAEQSQPFVEMRRVSKSFASESGRNEVLQGVDLRIERGEFVAIVGYSGSGKTTLISLLAGLIQPDSGEVLLNGKRVEGPGADRGVVFQNYSLLPWLTVYQNVYLAVDQVLGHGTADEKRKRTEHFVGLVGLAHASSRKPSELSGGMRQRVAVARALAMDPEVLLLDEPLGALDALTRGTLQREIEQIWRLTRKTVIMITNDVDEAILLADRVIPLSAGPRASLGPSFLVDIERPRDKKAINHHPEFKHVRARAVEYLLESNAARRREEKQREGVSSPTVLKLGVSS